MRTNNGLDKTIAGYVMLGEEMEWFREHDANRANRNGIYYK